jgi:hypothetical protein
MDFYKAALFLTRLFGVVWIVVGVMTSVGTALGAAFTLHLEGVWYFLLQYFIYGVLEILAGLALIVLGRPIARFAARKL